MRWELRSSKAVGQDVVEGEGEQLISASWDQVTKLRIWIGAA